MAENKLIHLDSERLLRFEQHQAEQDIVLLDIKHRLANLEKGQAGIKAEVAHLYEMWATSQVSIDKLTETTGAKLDLILSRLDSLSAFGGEQ